MTSPQQPGDDYGQASWDRRWSQAWGDGAHADRHPPNAHLLEAAADLPAGRALDAGAGHGTETLWLASHGWRVTAVDFSTTAVDFSTTALEPSS